MNIQIQISATLPHRKGPHEPEQEAGWIPEPVRTQW